MPSFNEQHGQLVEQMDAMAEKRDAFIKTYDPDGPKKLLWFGQPVKKIKFTKATGPRGYILWRKNSKTY